MGWRLHGGGGRLHCRYNASAQGDNSKVPPPLHDVPLEGSITARTTALDPAYRGLQWAGAGGYSSRGARSPQSTPTLVSRGCMARPSCRTTLASIASLELTISSESPPPGVHRGEEREGG